MFPIPKAKMNVTFIFLNEIICHIIKVIVTDEQIDGNRPDLHLLLSLFLQFLAKNLIIQS